MGETTTKEQTADDFEGRQEDENRRTEGKGRKESKVSLVRQNMTTI